MIQISAGEFKVKCLNLIDLAEKKHEIVVITKHGVPIAKLVPYEDKSAHLFGFMSNSVVIKGDILEPVDEGWDAGDS